MRTDRIRILLAGAAALAALVFARPAAADDKDLLKRTTAPPNLMLVFGNSQTTEQPILGSTSAWDGDADSPASKLGAAKRGEAVVIFCTGLGGVSPQRGLQIARTPVSATIGRLELKPIYAGLTPGFIGLYQVNVILLIDTPPGVNLPLRLSQGGATSNTVLVSVQ